jgi:RHS repeat-associated protein
MWAGDEKTGSQQGREYFTLGEATILRQKSAITTTVVYTDAYLYGDHLGSSSVTTDASGAKTHSTHYRPYGSHRDDWGTDPADRDFTNQRLDAATATLDYGARRYDPWLGRFIQPDTIVPDPTNPQSLNRYAYTLNNPLRYRDPTGHDWDDVVYNVQEFTGGFLAEWAYVNTARMAQSLAVQPNESAAATAGRVAADVASAYQGVEEIAGGIGLMGGGTTVCATGALCPAGAAVVVGGAAVTADGAMVATYGAVNGGTNLSNLVVKAQGTDQGSEPSVVYRGGNSLRPNRGEVKFDKQTGMVLPQRGVSTNTDPAKVVKYGGAYRIQSLPKGLQFRQVGSDPGHYEIIPSEAMPWERYDELLDQIATAQASQP